MAFRVQKKMFTLQVVRIFSCPQWNSFSSRKKAVHQHLLGVSQNPTDCGSVVQGPSEGDYPAAHMQGLPKPNTTFLSIRGVHLVETPPPSSVAWEIPVWGSEALTFKFHSLGFFPGKTRRIRDWRQMPKAGSPTTVLCHKTWLVDSLEKHTRRSRGIRKRRATHTQTSQ